MANSDLKVVPHDGELVKRMSVGDLKSLTGCTRFGQRVIRAMAKGEIPAEVGTKLMYTLNIQAGMVKDMRILDEFAERIEMIQGVK